MYLTLGGWHELFIGKFFLSYPHSSFVSKFHLLRGKVKVESGLEPVKVELSRGEESLGGGGGCEGESGCGLLRSKGGLTGGSRALLLLARGSSQMTGQNTTLLVAGIKGVDERVDTGAVGAIGNAGKLARLVVHLVVGGKLGGVGVKLEVPVGWVMGIDEGVEVGVYSVDVVVVGDSLDGLLGLLGLNKTGSCGYRGGLLLGGVVSVKGGRVETVGSGRNVGTFQDSESVLASCVLDSDGLAVIANIAVLAHTFAVSARLLSEDTPVFLGEGGAESSVAGVESLLL